MPLSLFKENTMRKAAKSQLAKEMVKNTTLAVKPQSSIHVVDGGFLLRAVTWPSDATYGSVLEHYLSYIERHYGKSSVIVFDGYCNGPSTKDHEHKRRKTKHSPDVVVELKNVAYKDQSAFMSNDKNKAAFISLLTTYLQSAGYKVHQAVNDADTLVVDVAMKIASAQQVVSVIANDTDILVMLVHHFSFTMSDIYMYTGVQQRIYCIRDIAEALGASAVSRLLVVHAITGCDTTSALFGQGKVTSFKKLTRATNVDKFFDIMPSPVASHDDVLLAGCNLISLLYGGVMTEKLNHLRYCMYMNVSATSNNSLQPEKLIPTENAAKFHVHRSHLQIVQWKLLSTEALNPDQWGWKLHEGQYMPVAIDVEIAPPDILNIACCKCSNTSKKQCGTRLCKCVKYGLSCVSACKNCNGVSCENAGEVLLIDDDLVEDDYAGKPECSEFIEEYSFTDDYFDYMTSWVVDEEVVTEMPAE